MFHSRICKLFCISSTLVPKLGLVCISSTLVPKLGHSPFGRRHITSTTTKQSMVSSRDVKTNLRNGKDGSYQRHTSGHRHFIRASDTTTIENKHPVEAGRYHLHVALACPWACGALAMLKLKGLDEVISHSIVHPTWAKTKWEDDSDVHCGWVYKNPGDEPMSNPKGYGSFPCDDTLKPDTFTNVASVRELYELGGDPDGPFTVPVLWDKKNKTIVNNESMEILRMLNKEFNAIAKNPTLDLYPAEFEEELQKLNEELVYPKINNGVYRCGFATSQRAYEEAAGELFEALDVLEERLSERRYLAGSQFTWLDLRLFMTLVRFDPVYVTYFKTNLRRIADYPNLLGYLRDIYSMDEVKDTINMEHIKMHYFTSHPTLNIYGIIPVSNGPDLEIPHSRENM